MIGGQRQLHFDKETNNITVDNTSMDESSWILLKTLNRNHPERLSSTTMKRRVESLIQEKGLMNLWMISSDALFWFAPFPERCLQRRSSKCFAAPRARVENLSVFFAIWVLLCASHRHRKLGDEDRRNCDATIIVSMYGRPASDRCNKAYHDKKDRLLDR